MNKIESIPHRNTNDLLQIQIITNNESQERFEYTMMDIYNRLKGDFLTNLGERWCPHMKSYRRTLKETDMHDIWLVFDEKDLYKTPGVVKRMILQNIKKYYSSYAIFYVDI